MVKRHIAEYLERKGVEWHARAHPRRVTAQEIAASMHVSGKRFAKTVVVEHEGRLALAVLPAHEDVDLTRLAAVFGPDVRLAREETFESRFGDCEIGAMPPLGELYGMEVVVDAHLAGEPSVLFNGGTHEDTIEMPWGEFEGMHPVRVVDFGRAERGAAARAA